MDIRELIGKSNLQIEKSNLFFDEPMKKHTSFKIGGPADCYIKITSKEALREILQFANNNQLELTVLGNGSNVLVSDKGIRGITIEIKLEQLEIVRKEDNIEITVGAGYKLAKLGYTLRKEEISGFEELAGIPGSIGGAIKMNAGAHGKEMKDIVKEVVCMDMQGNVRRLKNEELEFSYRNSNITKNNLIVVETILQLQKGNKEAIKEKMDEYATFRKEKQPWNYPSAGSTFKRGNDFITAKLIDEAGLKGYQIGGAQVSTKHAGFVVNTGDATAKDVLALVAHVKKTIHEKFEKEIKLEIECIGEACGE